MTEPHRVLALDTSTFVGWAHDPPDGIRQPMSGTWKLDGWKPEIVAESYAVLFNNIVQAISIAGAGHNVSKKKVTDFYKRYCKLGDEFASASGEFRSDVKELLEEAAAALDMPRKIIRFEFGKLRAEERRKAKEAEFETSEKDSLETLRAALGDFIDTPLGKAASGGGDE